MFTKKGLLRIVCVRLLEEDRLHDLSKKDVIGISDGKTTEYYNVINVADRRSEDIVTVNMKMSDNKSLRKQIGYIFSERRFEDGFKIVSINGRPATDICITSRDGIKLRKDIAIGCRVSIKSDSEYFKFLKATNETGTVLNIQDGLKCPFRVCFENRNMIIWCSEDEIELV